MCDLFSFNYSGPSYSTIKRDNKKGIQHVAGEYGDIFASVANIYKDAKMAHGITGPVLVILVEDETKVRSRVAYEQRFDNLSGFCGSKKNMNALQITNQLSAQEKQDTIKFLSASELTKWEVLQGYLW